MVHPAVPAGHRAIDRMRPLQVLAVSKSPGADL